jgi:AcrR family transcriptional regulator
MKRATYRSGRPRRESPPAHSDLTRAKLLEAAGRIFADKGYEAATIREICRAARANVAAVNYHFGDKQGLYAEVLQKMGRAAQLERMTAALDESAPPEELLRRVIKVRVEGLRSEHLPDWHFRMVAREFANPTPEMTRMLDRFSRPLYERLLELVGRIIHLPPKHETTRLCTQSIWGQISLYVLAGPILSRLWPELKMTPAQLDRIGDHIANFSLAYLRNIGKQSQSIQSASSSGPGLYLEPAKKRRS